MLVLEASVPRRGLSDSVGDAGPLPVPTASSPPALGSTPSSPQPPLLDN